MSVSLPYFKLNSLGTKTYQHHDMLHVLKLLRVEEGCEFFFVRLQVPVQIGGFEPPLVSRKHLLEAELVCGIFELFWVG